MAVSGKNRNGVSPGALRRSVDGVFLAPGDPRREEYAALVGQYPAAALRHILERGDKALLAAAIVLRAVLEELDCLNVPDFTAVEQGFFWNVLRLTRQGVTV